MQFIFFFPKHLHAFITLNDDVIKQTLMILFFMKCNSKQCAKKKNKIADGHSYLATFSTRFM